MKTCTLGSTIYKQFNRCLSKLLWRTNTFENKLLQQPQEYKEIVEYAPDIICQVDKELHLTYINRVIKDLVNIDQQYFIGKRISDITIGGEHFISLWVKNLQKVFATNEKTLFEAACTYQNNNHYFQIYMNPTPAKDGSVHSVICVARNITKEKQLEEELARLNRLNLIGKMAASIGHEVRNPMTTVRGFLQILGKREENSRNNEYYQIMIDELDRANLMLTEFLSLSKIKALLLTPANLNLIISSIYPLLSASALEESKNIEVELNDIEDALLDQKEIRQLIFNLVRNSLEASKPHSTITIQTFMDEKNIVLAIKDQGSGIPQHILEKIGTPFLTTKETGTGLGLAVCYSIARHHKAVITPITAPCGTTFYIRFEKR